MAAEQTEKDIKNAKDSVEEAEKTVVNQKKELEKLMKEFEKNEVT